MKAFSALLVITRAVSCDGVSPFLLSYPRLIFLRDKILKKALLYITSINHFSQSYLYAGLIFLLLNFFLSLLFSNV